MLFLCLFKEVRRNDGIAYFASKISNNIAETPEGYLVARNVPIGRTGHMEYLGAEIGDTERRQERIKVHRNEDELFSKATLASFEGKIVTNEHPPDLLTPETSQRYSKGVVQNVRRSKDEPDLMLADLIIHERRLIEDIKNGKREVSSGYDCIYVKNDDGTYSQTNIRGNHVAVVEAGRAGHRVSIKDSKSKESEGDNMSKLKMPRKKPSTTTKFLAAIGLKHLAMDAEPEDIAQVVDDMAEEGRAEDEEVESREKANDNGEGVASPEIAAINDKIDKLTSIVEAIVTAKDEETSPEDAIDEVIKEIEDSEESEIVETEDGDLEEGDVSDPEDRPTNPVTDSKAWVATLKAIKPVIAAIPDAGERKKACDSLLKEYKKATKAPKGRNTYSAIAKSQKQSAVDNASNQRSVQDMTAHLENLGDQIAKKYNANLKGGN
ncbi:hypothetical protein EUAN_08650 [Andreesenia angusta]|uniref:DUF2213 domain-containing protein n=1 Tax=Andreesenia angusta TaxID=39480 RepID=A0A1S1V8Y8_9FIRM|nr:hypothetical protein EUAN_08650 [Andreesenia angusta]